jgi:thiol-disulfide isomerase/thioredoxin
VKTNLVLLGAFALSALCSVATAFAGATNEQQPKPAAIRLSGEGTMPSLSRATQWLNSEAITPADLRGKVVLIDFWTYTCINWLRTVPYVRAWSEKYKDQGLVVIGVHSPEFEFEKDIANVSRAVKALNIPYPVAVDSDHAIWRAFSNNYWPALYFIDAQGRIRHHQFGEGEYDKAERIIQQLLSDSGASAVKRDLVSVNGRGVEAAPDWRNLRSNENYLGYERTQGFASTKDAVLNKSHIYALPSRLRVNQWALAGDWTMHKQATRSNAANGRIAYRFHARDVHLVMGPAVNATQVRFRVLIDGKPPGAAHGTDVDEQGHGLVTDQRLYQLIRQRGAIEDRQIEIEFPDAGVEAFAFTFG